MSRALPAIAFALIAAAAPATASTYSAKPVTAPESARIIARDISWACGPADCRGSTAESRPAILCEGLAKRAGRLDSFVADGRAFGAAELAKCNASAKRGTGSASSQASAN